jgi:hypothetical protein
MSAVIRPPSPAAFPLAVARVLVLGLTLAALGGCGLFQRDDVIGFRTYVLKDVAYEDAASIVYEVTRSESNRLFGGVTMTWDEALGNLELEPVYDGQRRLRLYIHLAPTGADVNVDMFALVDHLEISVTHVGYGESMQDVPLEEKLFQAYVAELSRRRDGGG